MLCKTASCFQHSSLYVSVFDKLSILRREILTEPIKIKRNVGYDMNLSLSIPQWSFIDGLGRRLSGRSSICISSVCISSVVHHSSILHIVLPAKSRVRFLF
jgi:hypothetical protein